MTKCAIASGDQSSSFSDFGVVVVFVVCVAPDGPTRTKDHIMICLRSHSFPDCVTHTRPSARSHAIFRVLGGLVLVGGSTAGFLHVGAITPASVCSNKMYYVLAHLDGREALTYPLQTATFCCCCGRCRSGRCCFFCPSFPPY